MAKSAHTEEEAAETLPLPEVVPPPLLPPPPVMSPAVPTTTPGVRLVEAPVLLLLHFHNALREELADLYRTAAESSESESCDRGCLPELRRRFDFLKLVYKYHSAAEDEVIFRALDVHTKNVVSAYSLEHRSTDDIFDSIYHHLDDLKEERDGDISKPMQELVYSINMLQTTICKHMAKEEEQVFPLLTQQLSTKEQASLVWQFISSVPMILLEDFFRWMNSFLSSDERDNVLQCVKEVVPEDSLLQEVVTSCLEARKQPLRRDFDKYGKGSTFLNGHADFLKILKVYTSEGHFGEELKPEKGYMVQTEGQNNPLDCSHVWHVAYHKDLVEVLEELYIIRGSNNYSGLVPLIFQLKFLTDIIVFYSNALDKLFYPMCIELAEDFPAPSYQQFLDNSQIGRLLSWLYNRADNAMPERNYVEKLCEKMEVCVIGIHKYLMFVEREVFPIMVINCSREMQQWLLCMSLEMMPLGLLKCTITWLSTHLSEEVSKSILCSLKQGSLLVNNSFSALLYEWIRAGYSGKTSVQKFREELQEVFQNRCSFISEQINDESGFLQLDIQLSNRSDSRQLDSVSTAKAKNGVSSSSSSSSNTIRKYETSYSSRINFHVFFPQKLRISTPFSTYPKVNSDSSFCYPESRPVDHILFFHKALKKDMEHLILLSASMAENDALFTVFYKRFHLVRFLYQIHSEAEDEIAFPAIEAKAKFQNSSRSYSIDHRLEVEHFNRIFDMLDQISELHLFISSCDMDTRGGKMLTYRRLCVKLHDMCISMNKLLCDHVNHEEIELWPLFGEHLSLGEQEKIIGCMLGRIRAETLQEMIPWLMAFLTLEEQNAILSLWRKTTKNTMFDQWLGEWWEGMKRNDVGKFEKESTLPSASTADALELISKYLQREGFEDRRGNLSDKGGEFSKGNNTNHKMMHLETPKTNDKEKAFSKGHSNHHSLEISKICLEVEKHRSTIIADVTDQVDKDAELLNVPQKFRHQEELLNLSQDELEATIRRVYSDSTLEPQKKPIIVQNLLMSRWINTQRKSHPEVIPLTTEQEIPGIWPSYRDPDKLVFGCKHYKRNCKLMASCCNKLYTCRHCHDDTADHSMDRKATTMMMCMKCLIIQPIGPTCSTVSCDNLSMARYYCRICKLFDDERQIYHCPYCNLCRVGKGLGIDYFHCMNCNACMSRSLVVHICREKCFEDNCPICHEYIFTSSSPVKALPCGHLMHSSCFQDYTCSNYTCPICSKSLGDMQVYFGMLDAMLAEEKIPEEYSGKTQNILCNDCEKRGTASFHWLYHKCPHCGSYNTRLL